MYFFIFIFFHKISSVAMNVFISIFDLFFNVIKEILDWFLKVFKSKHLCSTVNRQNPLEN